MTRVARSYQERTIQAVWDWYEFQSRILADEHARVFLAFRGGAIPQDSRFFALTHDEIDGFFDEHRRELDYLVMLDLLTSAEAAIRIDFSARVEERRKDPVSRRFRYLSRQQREKISLEQHILKTWKTLVPNTKSAIGDFLGALRLRDWLAHGRYWNPKLGRRYSPSDVYDITNGVLAAF